MSCRSGGGFSGDMSHPNQGLETSQEKINQECTPAIKPRGRLEWESFGQNTKPKVKEIYLVASLVCSAITVLSCSQTYVFAKLAWLSPSYGSLDKLLNFLES